MSKQSTNTLKYLTDKSIGEAKKEKHPHLLGQIIVILFGVILIILGAVDISFGGYKIAEALQKIFESVGQALIVGTAISVILDLPFMQKYYKNRIIDILVGNEYLNSLPESELERLRKECTEKIYIKKTKHFEPTLLELDEKISKLLTEPYCSTYRVEITCYKEEKFIKKKASIKYWIENPLTVEAVEKIDGIVQLYSVEAVEKKELFKINKLTVKIDNQNTIDYSDKIEYRFSEEKNDKSPAHNHFVSLLEKGTDNNLSFRFKDKLEIEIEDERIVPENDNIYVKRIKNPTKNFQIHYSVVNMNCKLQGACLGATVGIPLKPTRTVMTEKSISIESFDWLLPGNGIMIAAIPT